MEHRTESKDHREGKKLNALCPMLYAPNTALDGKVRLSTKAMVFLIMAHILFLIFFPQKAQTQETTASEISNPAAQMEGVEGQLVSIDSKFASMKRELDSVNNRLSALRAEEERPKGFLKRVMGVFTSKRKKRGTLFSRSQELAGEMSKLQEQRKPLVGELIILADKIIEKSNLRITLLGEIFLSTDYATREEERKQLSELSTLWGIAERARKAREKYAPDTIGPEDEWSFPTLFSDDPVELRLLAATLKDAAAEERRKADQLDKRIQRLELEVAELEYFLRVSEEMQRREEEREASGVGLSHIPWDEMTTEREIEDKKGQIDELKTRKQESEERAERYQRQAEEIDVALRGKLEDD
ncbi:hypothetical protein ACFL6S_20475 [Candidatus Poribacteria bacterium]